MQDDLNPYEKANILLAIASDLKDVCVQKEWDGEKIVITFTIYR